MNIQELIKEYEGAPFSIVSINGVLEDLKQLDEPQPIKLKDVIARIENFDLGTKAVWINEILYKLGSDYGLHKYYAGYKQGKFDGSIEREKVTVPQFVADWLKYCKLTGVDLYHALEMGDLYFCNYANKKDDLRLKDFFETENNQEIFARAWLDGYEVEKEKQYRVKMKNAYYNKYPQFLCETDNGIFWAAEIDLRKTKFTRKELKEAGFGWVFDCPGIEIKEVEE